MRKTLCKSFAFLFIYLCFFVSLAGAQDTSKVIRPATKKPDNAATKSATATKPAPPTTVIKQKYPAGAQPVAVRDSKAVVKVLPPPRVVDNSLRGQYEELLRNSWMQKGGYKVVNAARLSNLWKSVSDSIAASRKAVAAAKSKLEASSKQTAESKTSSESPTASESSKSPGAENVEILGMTVDWSTYNWIVWGTILVLGLALGAVVFTTSKNSTDAKSHKQMYEQITSEYQSYKAKAKEKELKLARELQTERNTIEDLLSRQKEEASGGEVKPKRSKT